MKYVDDLLRVDPEDIKHSERHREKVVAIVHCPNADAYKEVVVVFSDGKAYSYNRKGNSASRMPQTFVFKTKKISMTVEMEVYKCLSCDSVSLYYDSGQPYVKTKERVIDCRKCEELDIGLWGLVPFDLKIEEGEGLE